MTALVILLASCVSTRASREPPPARAAAEGVEPSPNPRAGEPPGEVADDASGRKRAGGTLPARPEQPGTREQAPRSEKPSSVREAVLGAVTATGRPAYGIPRALHAITGMLEQVPGVDSSMAASIGRMRRETIALERLGAVDLDRADHVKAALDQGIDAMNAYARRSGAWLEPWVEAAANAVNVLDPGIPLGLQRTACQDALRALADAVLVAWQFGRCETTAHPLEAGVIEGR